MKKTTNEKRISIVMKEKLVILLIIEIFAFHSSLAQTDTSIKINNVATFQFRRTYANAQFMKNEKDRKTYYKKQNKSNPITDNLLADSLGIKKQLEILGCFKGKELILKKFHDLRDSISEINILQGEKITAWRSGSDSIQYIINLLHPSSQKNTSINSYEFPLKYLVADLIPGGFYELALVTEWYIMNGYNYDVIVYEFKPR